MSNVIIAIPARLNPNGRLPNKLLIDINGKTLLQRTWENCVKIKKQLPYNLIQRVQVLTDSDEIINCAVNFGAEVVKTYEASNGTDRISQVYPGLYPCDMIINNQAEWPNFTVDDYKKIMDKQFISYRNNSVLSLYYELDLPYEDDNKTKVVLNKINHAMYFSRYNIPFYSDLPRKIHCGIYLYWCEFLQQPCVYDTELNSENLEQLAWLYRRDIICLSKTDFRFGIDTQEDLDEYKQYLKEKGE